MPPSTQPPTTPDVFTLERSLDAPVGRRSFAPTGRIADVVWNALHVLGAHHWRDGYETNLERGWSRYRGSRCTICDEPWEGW